MQDWEVKEANMGHYVKAERIKCHYNFDPNCPMCHGDENYRDKYDLPCRCGLENMTFDKPEDVLMMVEAEPMPDGGMSIRMEEVEQEEN